MNSAGGVFSQKLLRLQIPACKMSVPQYVLEIIAKRKQEKQDALGDLGTSYARYFGSKMGIIPMGTTLQHPLLAFG